MLSLDSADSGQGLAEIVLSCIGAVTGVAAIVLSMRSDARAARANEIAERALKLEEDGGKVRIFVMPYIRPEIPLESRPHRRVLDGQPVVRIVNLSRFPVWIRRVWFRMPNPHDYTQISAGNLPIRLEPHAAHLVIIEPDAQPVGVFHAVVSVVAETECGQRFEGMSKEWREHFQRLGFPTDSPFAGPNPPSRDPAPLPGDPAPPPWG